MFEYVFMQRALVVGLLLGLSLPCIGLMVILRRQSMIGDALSHSSLAGVAAGLIMGFNPLVGAMLTAVLAAFGIDFLRRRLGRYSEMAIAIIMSLGIGLASLLSDFVKTAANFHSFLFGSIVALNQTDIYLTLGLTLVVLLLFTLFAPALFFSAYAPREARLVGVNLRLTDSIFTLLTALVVSLAARTVGALIVSSFMVIPAACSMQLARSFKTTLLGAIICSEIFTLGGLILSFKLNLKPGGTFVLLALGGLLLSMTVAPLLKKRRHKRSLAKEN